MSPQPACPSVEPTPALDAPVHGKLLLAGGAPGEVGQRGIAQQGLPPGLPLVIPAEGSVHGASDVALELETTAALVLRFVRLHALVQPAVVIPRIDGRFPGPR